jgi:hypothetical protein
MKKVIIEFENNNRKFVYEFSKLKLKQIESARAVAELKEQQSTQIADHINTVFKSGGADWLANFVSLLILEVKDGITSKFNRDYALSNVLEFVEDLPATEHSKMEGIVKDFFTSINEPQTAQRLLVRDTKLNKNEILSVMMQSLMLGKLKESGS